MQGGSTPLYEQSDFSTGVAEDFKNSCVGGPKFVSGGAAYTGADSAAYWVGVQRCSGNFNEFKFYMSASKSGTYWPVCDGEGSGENQCQLIGGADGLTSYSTDPAPSNGYSVNNHGDSVGWETPCPHNWHQPDYVKCPIGFDWSLLVRSG